MYGISRESGSNVGVRVAVEAMRTRFEIVLNDADADPTRLRAAGEAALAEILEVETLLSPYRADSTLYEVNTRAAGGPVPVAGRLFRLLESATQYSAQTGGAFDMTVGPLLHLWSHCAEQGRLPTEDEISTIRARVGMTRVVELDAIAQAVTFSTPGVSLHPGAIGKGYALDQAATLLREAGVQSALLHGGTSTIVAIGGPWRIAIQHPTEPQTLLHTADLQDNALSVSAVHGKTFHAAGRRFGHILDPRTGHPIAHTLLAASRAATGTETEVLSTAALVLGSSDLALLTKQWPEAGFLIAEDEQTENDSPRVTLAEGNWVVR